MVRFTLVKQGTFLGAGEDIKKALALNKGECPKLQNAWNKYGSEAFVFGIVEVCPLTLLNKRENFWIEKSCSYDRNVGYNVERFAAGSGPISAETRLKLSRSHLGQRAWNKGIPRDEATRQKISASKKGKIPPQNGKGLNSPGADRNKYYFIGKMALLSLRQDVGCDRSMVLMLPPSSTRDINPPRVGDY
jgi:group I intron endonuclease